MIIPANTGQSLRQGGEISTKFVVKIQVVWAIVAKMARFSRSVSGGGVLTCMMQSAVRPLISPTSNTGVWRS